VVSTHGDGAEHSSTAPIEVETERARSGKGTE